MFVQIKFTTYKLLTLIMGVSGLILLSGCGDGKPERVSVSGQVLIDDKPLTYGQVFFIPPNGRTARAKIGPDGRFTLTSFNANDGAIKGIHKIAIYANEQLNSNDIKWHAPIKYSKELTSGLTQEITGPTDNVVIKLTWDGGKPFIVKGDPEDEGRKGKL